MFHFSLEKTLESSFSGTSGLFEISWSHNICASGEIGQEFEAQMDELRREDQERARVEAEQSEKLIAEMMKNEPEIVPNLSVGRVFSDCCFFKIRFVHLIRHLKIQLERVQSSEVAILLLNQQPRVRFPGSNLSVILLCRWDFLSLLLK